MRVLIASKYAGQLVGGAELSVEQFVKSRWKGADIIRLSGVKFECRPKIGGAKFVKNYLSVPRLAILETLINIFLIRREIKALSPDVVVFFSFWSVVAGFMDGLSTNLVVMLRAESCCGVRSFVGRETNLE